MSKNLIPAQRRERIQEYLALQRIVSSSELSRLLSVSEATVRRDLEWLEKQGVLERTHGGAILSRRMRTEPQYMQRAARNVEEKRAIGLSAVSFLEEGDIVFINSGTTTTEMIKQIPRDANITVFTNNLQAALEVGEVGYELILLGGNFQPTSNSVAGRFALEILDQVYANKTFVSVDGVSLRHGCTVPSSMEAELIRKMLERTQGVRTLLVDHSKWGVVSNFEVARLDQIHRLITDDGLDRHTREMLDNLPIEV
ncbi:MAG: DeoR/GlpR family DNA-binding transcription regulator, partial [Anaerolineales bacterium]|nr:DeoR/GlpR family DNA-binding transcription regulator [Anaerolineales bacterium]MDW8445660.1 DeoR/GlpR family DNA-binding transcription regulator [Anaerolineales bacterium]